MKNQVNRRNNCTVHFMINEAEMKELNKRFELSGYRTKREFYRDAIFKNKIISIDISGEFKKELRGFLSLLSRNSANLNQITKHINSTGVIYKKDIELMHSGLELELSFLAEFREKVSNFIINKVIS